MNNNDERVMLLENLINNIRLDIISMKLIEKELTYLRYKNITTTEEIKSKLIELLLLSNDIKVMENLNLGLAKL